MILLYHLFVVVVVVVVVDFVVDFAKRDLLKVLQQFF
jgi:hypothetical protein